MKRFRTKAAAMLCASALALCAVSCGDSGGMLHDMLDIEARTKKNAPPSTIEELKAGIRRYGDEVERTYSAMEKTAMYWRMLAIKYAQKGMYGEAYEAARKALEFYPDNAGLYYLAGLSASYLSRTAQTEPNEAARNASRAEWLGVAESSYSQTLRIDERHTKAMMGLATLYALDLEDHAAAVKQLEAFLAIDTKDVDALSLYARSLYGVGRLEDAAKAYDKVISTTKLDSVKQKAKANKELILKELYND